MHVWRGELQPDALRPVEHVFASQPGAPYSQKKGLLSQTFLHLSRPCTDCRAGMIDSAFGAAKGLTLPAACGCPGRAASGRTCVRLAAGRTIQQKKRPAIADLFLLGVWCARHDSNMRPLSS